MKLKLNLYYDCFPGDLENFKNLKINATTNDFDSEYHLNFKTVVVEIPDNLGITEKEYKDKFYLKKLSLIDQEIEIKERELYAAKEIRKNMLAISVEVEKE